MGTIAARDGLRILELTEQCAAAGLLIVAQAVQLRIRSKELTDRHLSQRMQQTLDTLREVAPFLEEDRALEGELRTLTKMIQERAFTFSDNLEPN